MSNPNPSSWEWRLEEWAIQQCNAAGTLGTLQLRHHDDEDQADKERVFFQAITGQQNPPGEQVYDTTLLVEFRSTDRDATQTDAIFAKILAVFINPSADVAANDYFGAGLWFDQEESNNARSDGANTRDRSRTFMFQVGQVDISVTVIEDDSETVIEDDAETVITSAA